MPRSDDEDDDAPRRRRRRDDDEEFAIPPGTPRVYVHEKCGTQTEMPPEEIEKYLDNPFPLDEDPGTWCVDCDKMVKWKKCYWRETEQNLYDYLDDLRAERVLSGTDPRTGPTLVWWVPLVAAAVLPVIGIIPFKGQNFSTVADRYFYLAMTGIALGVVMWLFVDPRRTLVEESVKGQPALASA